MTISVDRIEDSIAVVEFDDGSRLEIPASKLPANTREGDCFTLNEDGSLEPDSVETARRRKSNIDLFKSLLED